MNELSSPVSVESDNGLGDVIDSYAEEPNEGQGQGQEQGQGQVSETSGTFLCGLTESSFDRWSWHCRAFHGNYACSPGVAPDPPFPAQHGINS